MWVIIKKENSLSKQKRKESSHFSWRIVKHHRPDKQKTADQVWLVAAKLLQWCNGFAEDAMRYPIYAHWIVYRKFYWKMFPLICVLLIREEASKFMTQSQQNQTLETLRWKYADLVVVAWLLLDAKHDTHRKFFRGWKTSIFANNSQHLRKLRKVCQATAFWCKNFAQLLNWQVSVSRLLPNPCQGTPLLVKLLFFWSN